MSMNPTHLTIDEVESYIGKLAAEVYREVFTGATITKSEMDSGIYPTFRIQVIYNQPYNKAYLLFDIDKYARYNSEDFQKFSKLLIGRIVNTAWKDLNVKLKVDVINNTHYPTNDKGMKNSALAPYDGIRLNTISIFKDYEGRMRFLEDEILAIRNMYIKIYHDQDFSLDDRGIESKLEDFIEGIKTINEKYDFSDNSNVVTAFNEYAALYNTYFGVQLEAISDDNILIGNYIINYPNSEDS